MTQPRLGLIWPDDGLERPDYELLRGPEAATRLGVGGLTLEIAYSRAQPRHERADLLQTGALEHLLPAANSLSERGCEALVWACTSGSFIGGLAWAHHQARELEAATGLPASSTTLAFIDALKSLDFQEVDLLGAYPAPVSQAFRYCLAEAGLTVINIDALDTPDAPASYRLDIKQELERFARTTPGNRPLLLPDTAINSLEWIEEMEQLIQRPILTANQVTLWQGVRLLAMAPGRGPGCLFNVNPRP